MALQCSFSDWWKEERDIEKYGDLSSAVRFQSFYFNDLEKEIES